MMQVLHVRVAVSYRRLLQKAIVANQGEALNTIIVVPVGAVQRLGQ